MRASLHLLLAVVSLLYTQPARAEEIISLVADVWCPYNCETDTLRRGTMVRIAERAFARHGITVRYATVPWTRAIEETRGGLHTAIVGASRSDAPDFIFPAIPQGHMRNTFYVKPGSAWKYTGVDSLPAVSIGTVADYTYGKELDGYLTQHAKNTQYVQSLTGDDVLDRNVKKLLAGRIGTLIEADAVMAYYLSTHQLEGKVVPAGSVQPSDTDNLYIAFSPTHPKAKEYAKILTDEVRAMRKSGELGSILAAYHVEDWEPAK